MVFENREDAGTVASSTECTGLTPALTDEAGEADERRLYDVTAARRKGAREKAK